jgi:hypothetical protein
MARVSPVLGLPDPLPGFRLESHVGYLADAQEDV